MKPGWGVVGGLLIAALLCSSAFGEEPELKAWKAFVREHKAESIDFLQKRIAQSQKAREHESHARAWRIAINEIRAGRYQPPLLRPEFPSFKAGLIGTLGFKSGTVERVTGHGLLIRIYGAPLRLPAFIGGDRRAPIVESNGVDETLILVDEHANTEAGDSVDIPPVVRVLEKRDGHNAVEAFLGEKAGDNPPFGYKR